MLVGAMLFAMTACAPKMKEMYVDPEWETEESTLEETEDPTEESTQEPTEETVPVGPVNYEGLPLQYKLTQEDVDLFYETLEQCEKLAMESTDEEVLDEIGEELEDQYNYLEDQCSIAQIIYYCDLTDEAASRQYLDCTDLVTEADNAYKQMLRRVYQSDAPGKDLIFEDWTEAELTLLVNYTEEIKELEKRNAEILVEYQSLEDQTSDEMVPLFLEKVANNNRIAQIYGYDNYYVFAYEVGYSRDYDHTEIANMRSYAANYLAPAIADGYGAFYASMLGLDTDQQQMLITLVEGDYNDLEEDYLQNYLNALPETMQASMKEALKEENCYFTNDKNAEQAAFTAVLSDRCFCYFGPGYAKTLTLAHELGHYYGGQFADLDLLSLDLAETQSQGNEWLMLHYLSGELDEDLFEAIVNYKLYENSAVVMISILVDQFEEQVYTHEDPQSLDADDLYEMMEQICKEYGGEDYIATYVTSIHDYWRMVVVENPVYYISYGVSAVSAMSVYTSYQTDFAAAVEAYRCVVENDGTLTFLDTLEDAGLPHAFDEEVYVEISKMFS